VAPIAFLFESPARLSGVPGSSLGEPNAGLIAIRELDTGGF
jgi:hypothetical protein